MNSYDYNRNYGCRFKEIIENGYRALILENEKIRVSIYLDKGSDIYEFLYKPADIDFMWKSPNKIQASRKTPFTKEQAGGNFLDIYEGGWQDILPNIGNPTNYLGGSFGVHGELFTRSFDYQVLCDAPEEVKIKLYTRMNRAPLFIEKVVMVKRNKAEIEIEETVKNEAEEEYKFMWAQHPAIGYPFLDDSCVIDVPDSKHAKTYQHSLSSNKVIPLDKKFDWPFINSPDGKRIDLSKIMPETAKTSFSVFLEDISEGWYGITNLNKKIGFGLIWDKNIYKHLFMWMAYRGAYGYPWYGRTYNIALEPWSALPDDFDAVDESDFIRLKPEESLTTKYVAVIYKSSGRVNGFDSNYKYIK